MKLKQIYSDFLTTGAVFTDLHTHFGTDTRFPWLSNYWDYDLDYMGHSGNKESSPLLDFMLSDDGELSADARTRLANIIISKFGENWVRLYEVMTSEYNLIENYSMSETETPNLSNKHSVSSGYKSTDEKKTATDLQTSGSGSGSGAVYGFNSPSSASTTNSNANSTSSRVQGSANANTETVEHTQTGYTEDTQTGTRTMTRAGNIGVTTSQQMLESQIALWKWNFFAQIYKDIDVVLTTPVYTKD